MSDEPSAPFASLAAELAALAGRYVAAVAAAAPDDVAADLDVADGVASTLRVLVDVAAFARTRLEVRALMYAAMGNVVLGELAACLDAKRPGSE